MNSKSPEHLEQVRVIEWARSNAIYWPELTFLFAVPNGAAFTHIRGRNGKSFSPQANALLKEGMLPGVADLFLPAARGGYHGLFIEMKAGDNTLSEQQQIFLENMLAFGYLAMACWGAESAIDELRRYMRMSSDVQKSYRVVSINP